MSNWVSITGVIKVIPMGRTQHEKEYILRTAIEHLPVISGSEKDMDVHVIQRTGFNGFSCCDEFGLRTNNLVNDYGHKGRSHGRLQTQDVYFLMVDGELCDRMFHETYRDFVKWLCRLAKRVFVTGVMVDIDGDDGMSLILDDRFQEMWEAPSWKCKKPYPNSGNWCEYLMWE